jgi:hypothetical protein
VYLSRLGFAQSESRSDGRPAGRGGLERPRTSGAARSRAVPVLRSSNGRPQRRMGKPVSRDYNREVTR